MGGCKMNLAMYYQRIRLVNPTGVGKHIENMSKCLKPRVARFSSVHAIDDLSAARKRGIQDDDSVRTIRFPRKLIEAGWVGFDLPSIEMLGVKADWIYCPAEYYLATKRAKLAVTIHCDNWFNPDLPWYNDPDVATTRKRRLPLYRKIAQKADMVFCVSTFLRDRVRDAFNIPESRLAIVGNGVEAAFFNAKVDQQQLANEFPELSGSPYALIIGGLTRRKGGDATLEAIRQSEKAVPEMRFVIIGCSEQQFEHELTRLPNVYQMGYLNLKNGLLTLIGNAACLLFLSRYDTFGIPAIEALAAGVTPIVSEFGALPELVGSQGLVVSEKHYQDLPDILQQVVSDPPSEGEKNEMRKSALEFSWERCVDKVLSTLV
jgi:glycosyltransferase involved in cell wall biosynthesis